MAAVCSMEAPCSGSLREDREFAVHAARWKLAVRRFVCPAGHSHYLNRAELSQRRAPSPPATPQSWRSTRQPQPSKSRADG